MAYGKPPRESGAKLRIGPRHLKCGQVLSFWQSLLWGLGSLWSLSIGQAFAVEPPSYARQVRPFLARYCVECHSGAHPKGGLNLESYAEMVKGGDRGPSLVPHKPDDSLLVQMVESGKMPPKKARQPRPEEAAILRAWIASGARDDSAALRVALPHIAPRKKVAPAVTALSFDSKTHILAAGSYKELLFFDAQGELIARWSGLPGRVTAARFGPRGQLAVACSTPGVTTQIHLYSLALPEVPSETSPDHVLVGHTDAVYELSFSADGRYLVSGGYDRILRLWDCRTGKLLRELKDHSDAVYCVAFAPTGTLLASAGADRAVKVWDAESGRRLYTLGESTDWVYAVAWHPQGRLLAAAGVDKSIRVWEANLQGGKLVQSVFAHKTPVWRLAFSADGTTLFSLAEDGEVKAWDTDKWVEKHVYPRQPDVVRGFALRADGKYIALGRHDGVLLTLGVTDAKSAKTLWPAPARPPQITQIEPATIERGRQAVLHLRGKGLDTLSEIRTDIPGATSRVTLADPTRARIAIVAPGDAPPGRYSLQVVNSAGASKSVPIYVDAFPVVSEAAGNDTVRTAQSISLPATMVGTVHQAGQVDHFRFTAQAGQEVAILLTLGSEAKWEPILQCYDGRGQSLAVSERRQLALRIPTNGDFVVTVRDKEYRGAADFSYRLHIGPLPMIASVFPAGLQRGSEIAVALEGVHLGDQRSVRVRAPADAVPGSRIRLPLPKGVNLAGELPELIVSPFAEVVRPPGTDAQILSLPVPGVGNGLLQRPGESHLWRFRARKGQKLAIEVESSRLGFPMDSVIEVLDARHQPIARAVLRSLARTYVTFRDHDARSPGIRIENWSELAVNDYIFVGNELLRIRALPRNPDDDCQFFSEAGQRLGYLGTSPSFHAMGEPMYKVEIHPPGAVFAPNGFPSFTLYYRNDDGGPGLGRDSRLYFTAPADGDYLVRVSDARGRGGTEFVYRLVVREPKPDFTVSFSPQSPRVWRGGTVPVTVSLQRLDEFDGMVEVKVEQLPPGFSAPASNIGPLDDSTTLPLSASDKAVTPDDKAPPGRVVARATINGQTVVREALIGKPQVVEPGDIVTRTDRTEVVITPGGRATLRASIERRNGFSGRVPLDVRGLPHGVRVLDIGLNGILITEKESARTLEVYCEPWVAPVEHPIVVLARHEGKGTEHAAASVLLRVVPSPQAQRPSQR